MARQGQRQASARHATRPPRARTHDNEGLIPVLARALGEVEAAVRRGPAKPSVRTRFQVVALLAIFKAGAACLPLDPAYRAFYPDGSQLDVFADLNRAFMSPVVLRIAAGRIVTEPVVVTHTIGGSGTAVFPRLVIDAGENSEVSVIELFTAADGADDDVALVVPVLQVRAAQAARVKYLAVNEVGSKTWQIGNQQSVGLRDSSTTLATVTLGGEYVRARTEARLSGQGSSTKQVALYFAGGTQMHDFRTIQDHDAPNTSSDLLFKGAVQDHAASVYTGLIKIRKHANGTVAFQTNRNLTLSEGAWAESVPNLDIETNDVKCSHASTIGPIDEEQRFYLESRGVRPEIAERLVVLGFFEEVIAQLPPGPITADLRARVSKKLDLGATRQLAAAGDRS